METKNVLILITVLFGADFAKLTPVDTQDDEFHTEITPNGNVDEVKILDKDNKVVVTVEVFENEGFQIEKPAEADKPCFIIKIEEQDEQTNFNDTNLCYVRREVSHEEAKEMGVTAPRVFSHCNTLIVLEPQDCDVIDTEATGESRKKRGWPVGNFCCHYKRYPRATCVRYEETSKCCKHFLWICTSKCKKCVSYSTKYITEKICHNG